MRNAHLIIITFFLLLFAGCSSTYTLKDFSSKNKFYQNCNNSFGNKNLKIELTNDSSFTLSNGAQVDNDSLVFISKIIKEQKTLTKNNIKAISYFYNTNFSHPNIKVILKNGNELKGINIRLNPDSSIQYTAIKKLYSNMPISEVKEVRYKNHWLGIPARFISGSIAGFVSGFWAYSIINKNPQTTGDNFAALAGGGLGALSGAIIGGIIGWIDGYTYTYQFNP